MTDELMVYEGQNTDDLALRPVINLEIAKQRLAEFQEFVKSYLKEGEDFGTIPGTPKPTLYKPGADKLCDVYGLVDDYVIEDKVEDFDRGLFDYTIKCKLARKSDGSLIATGMGSCNSYEGKYRWRESGRKCLHCGKEAIIKGKEEYGGGFVCFGKKGGCGAKYKDDDKAITGQATGKVQNEDIATLKNTILKMAKKRAKIDAVLGATRSSGIFTQDVEDMGIAAEDSPRPKQEPMKAAQRASTSKPQTQQGSTSPRTVTRGVVGVKQVDPKMKQPTPLELSNAKKAKKDVPQPRPYFVLACTDDGGGEWPVYVFDTKFYEHVVRMQNKECDISVSRTSKEVNGETQNFYGLEHIHRIGDQVFENDVPQAEQGEYQPPTGSEMFPEQP